MDDLIANILAPENLLPALVYGILTSAIWAALTRAFSRNGMRRAAFVNAIVITILPAFGFAPGSYPWFVDAALGVALGMFFFIAAAVGSTRALALLLFATNAPAVWLAFVLADQNIPDRLTLFCSGYTLWSSVIGVMVAFSIFYVGSPEKVLEAMVERLHELIRRSKGAA